MSVLPLTLSLFDARIVTNPPHRTRGFCGVETGGGVGWARKGQRINKNERRFRSVYVRFLSYLSVSSIQLHKCPFSILGNTSSAVESSEQLFILFQSCIQSICKPRTNLEAAFVCTSNLLNVKDHISVCNFHFELGQKQV